MRFAVLKRKQNTDNPWVLYRWAPLEVLPDFCQFNRGVMVDRFLGLWSRCKASIEDAVPAKDMDLPKELTRIPVLVCEQLLM